MRVGENSTVSRSEAPLPVFIGLDAHLVLTLLRREHHLFVASGQPPVFTRFGIAGQAVPGESARAPAAMGQYKPGIR
jgi:hypothetical protein